MGSPAEGAGAAATTAAAAGIASMGIDSIGTASMGTGRCSTSAIVSFGRVSNFFFFVEGAEAVELVSTAGGSAHSLSVLLVGVGRYGGLRS